MPKLLILWCVTLLLNCNGQTPATQDNVKTFDRFPNETHLKLTNFIASDQGLPRKLYISDHFLITRNSKGSSEKFFSLFNIENKQLIRQEVGIGGGPGQVLNPLSSGVRNKSLWMHDISTSKFVILTIDKKDVPGFREYRLPAFFYSMQMNDSVSAYASGNYATTKKIEEIDLPTGKTTDSFGDYEDVPKSIPFYSWKRAYESFLFMHPNGEKLVMACRFADQIEIFDVRSKKSTIIKGPEKYNPEFTAFKANGMDLAERNEKTRFAFVNGATTAKYIYLLYSGNKHDSSYLDNGRYIYVYDWDGKPVKKIILPDYISCFAVDNDSSIYTCDIKTGFIQKADLKF